MDNWTSSIPISELPKTIQDALTVTRKIGLRFLWVDCLCIVQDDPEDTAKEISQIARIYQDAEVTISAARARNSQEGFLHDIKMPTPQDEAFRLPFRCPDGQIGSIIIYGQDNLYHKRDPIEERAWALQEHVLSPRLLVFGSRQIWSTCMEVLRRGYAGNLSSYSEIGEIRQQFLKLRSSPRRRKLAYIPGHMWLSIVQHFTDRVLSISEDKLPAISAIAEHYGTTTREDYFAGLFGSSLLSSLLWKKWSPTLPRPAEYRAPSWS